MRGAHQRVGHIFDQRSDHELTYEGLRLRVKSLLNSNQELLFVEQVMSFEISDEEIIALLFMCSQCVPSATTIS